MPKQQRHTRKRRKVCMTGFEGRKRRTSSLGVRTPGSLQTNIKYASTTQYVISLGRSSRRELTILRTQLTLRHHVPISTSSQHPFATVVTRGILGVVVGIALLHALSHVLIISRPVIKKGRSASEQVKADCLKLLGVSDWYFDWPFFCLTHVLRRS
jgi:hypothetical protein